MSTINSNGTMVFGNPSGGSATIAPKNNTSTNYTLTIPDISGTLVLSESPVLTGTPIAPTAISGTNNYQIANTTFVNNAISTIGTGIGVGQTWQDVKVNRAIGITYTNSTGKPIYISICGLSNGYPIVITVDSVVLFGTFTATGANYNTHMSLIVPNGSTYKMTNCASIYTWAELR
jgi:hypothetical protein